MNAKCCIVAGTFLKFRIDFNTDLFLSSKAIVLLEFTRFEQGGHIKHWKEKRSLLSLSIDSFIMSFRKMRSKLHARQLICYLYPEKQ